ncbi:HIG1 domain family member 2A, mitochondrial isoform X1 [Enhydra lutris kenyoni]|uniref:HIG1 domain family member 2A, mitochondrial isoform X1 n=1 Tax=Enhydra lutris kenyoni TaxID=391180 RepID=A0A2Y9IKL9_ENHLU|nr:HIG1 domain family member 2A, mitochondrial isoform X1 [Enhydra lutris kenyoni]
MAAPGPVTPGPPFEPAQPPVIEGFSPSIYSTQESFKEKFLRKTRENPMVPIELWTPEYWRPTAGRGLQRRNVLLPHLLCPLLRLPGHGGRPHLRPLLLPPGSEPALSAHDAHPDRCPGLHGRSHLAGSGCICYEVSILSPRPGLERYTEIVPGPRSNHRPRYLTYSFVSPDRAPYQRGRKWPNV